MRSAVPPRSSGLQLIVAAPGANAGAALARLLREQGMPAQVSTGIDAGHAPVCIVHLAPSADGAGEPMQALIERCMEIKACADRFRGGAGTLWLVFGGALANSGADIRPVETGAWAYSRTLANEFPHLDVRRIDIAPGIAAEEAVVRLRDIIVSGTEETELQIDDLVTCGVRVDGLDAILGRLPQRRAEAAKLQRRTAADRHLDWEPAERRAPEATEVEIAVEATGLNFRDVMWMMSLLPDDVIEDGFSGANIGLECSGRVMRVGDAVRAPQARATGCRRSHRRPSPPTSRFPRRSPRSCRTR